MAHAHYDHRTYPAAELSAEEFYEYPRLVIVVLWKILPGNKIHTPSTEAEVLIVIKLRRSARKVAFRGIQRGGGRLLANAVPGMILAPCAPGTEKK